jgi:hypothetical protein
LTHKKIKLNYKIKKRSKSKKVDNENSIDSNNYLSLSFTNKKEKKKTELEKGHLFPLTAKIRGRLSWKKKTEFVCMICKLPLKKNQQIVQCPMCQSLFHQEHIREWLRMKKQCPVCRQELKAYNLIELPFNDLKQKNE